MGKRQVTAAPGARGAFVISLDFELYWGVRDKQALAAYRNNLLAVHRVIPRLLTLFTEFGIHATWATVGFIFLDSANALQAALPACRPGYANPALSPYPYIEAGLPAGEESCHFAPELIRQIAATPGQEVATHTFSHYYCLEPGQTAAEFAADLDAAVRVANQAGVALHSIVFPRNQWNPAYLPICRARGILAYRGNPRSWLYAATEGAGESRVRRALRLLDAYLPLSGHNACAPAVGDGVVDVPASRFLRPFSPRLALVEPLRAQRIRAGMTHAARHGLGYHLWWHPHNFGAHTENNLAFLRGILEHYALLRGQHGMESLTMHEVCVRALGDDRHV